MNTVRWQDAWQQTHVPTGHHADQRKPSACDALLQAPTRPVVPTPGPVCPSSWMISSVAQTSWEIEDGNFHLLSEILPQN